MTEQKSRFCKGTYLRKGASRKRAIRRPTVSTGRYQHGRTTFVSSPYLLRTAPTLSPKQLFGLVEDSAEGGNLGSFSVFLGSSYVHEAYMLIYFYVFSAVNVFLLLFLQGISAQNSEGERDNCFSSLHPSGALAQGYKEQQSLVWEMAPPPGTISMPPLLSCLCSSSLNAFSSGSPIQQPLVIS